MSQKFLFLNEKNLLLFFKIFNNTINQELIGSDINVDRFKENIKFLNVKNNVSFILYDNNEPIGLFFGAIRGNKGYIPSMMVIKKYRNKGYGQILLQKGISLLFENNCRIINLDVFQGNNKAINLYLKLGFKITNEIINFRNENNSFYTNKKYNDYDIMKVDNFTYHFLYRTFHDNNEPWQKNLYSINLKIKNEEYKLFLLKKNNNQTKGYIVASMDNNIIYINDIGLKEEDYNLFSFFLSSVLNIFAKNIKIILANNFYINNPFCKLFKLNGFYIDIKQYEMEKKLV